MPEPIRWGAFLAALFAAPLLITLLLILGQHLTLFALYVGILPWLLIGGPLLAHSIRRGTLGYTNTSGAVAVIAAAITMVYAVTLLIRGYAADSTQFTLFPAIAAGFAGAWAATFVWLYRRMT